MKSRASIQGLLYNLGGTTATCLLRNTFFSLAHSHGRAFTDPSFFLREKNKWTECCLKTPSPLCRSHDPKYFLSLTSQWPPKAGSCKTIKFLATGIFLFNSFSPTYFTLYSLGCQGFVFFSLCLWDSRYLYASSDSPLIGNYRRGSSAKPFFQKLAQNHASVLKWVVETDDFNSSHLSLTSSAHTCVCKYCSICSIFLFSHPLTSSVH